MLRGSIPIINAVIIALQGFKNLMEHTKWPRRDDNNPSSPGTATSPGVAASTAASPSSVTSVFANGDKDRSKLGKREHKRSPGSEDAAQDGAEKSAGEEDEEEGRRGGLTKPVNSGGATLR